MATGRSASAELTRPGVVTVIGEALIDLVPSGDGDGLRALPGGSPYNVAIGLARLGVSTALMARLGAGSFGQALRARAEREGVDLTAAAAAAEPTTLAVVSLDAQARATYEFYVQGTADWQWTEAETARLPAATTILHFGSIASWTDPGAGPIGALARRVHQAQAAIVSYDPNIRPALLADRAAGRRAVERCLAVTHLVKASAEDAEWLYPGTPLSEVVTAWTALGPQLVVITDGAAGARVFPAAGAPFQRPGIEVAVVDTVGAGDSFTAALLASLARRGIESPEDLSAAGASELAGAVDDAILASAITCERPGADPPTAQDVAARSAAQGEDHGEH